MILCRSVPRSDILCRITSVTSCFTRRHINHIQGRNTYHGLNWHKSMDRGKKAVHSDNTKKYKTTDLVWRPVSSLGSADAVEENANLSDGNEGNTTEYGTSGCASYVQGAIKEAELAIVHSESAANAEIASDCNLDEAGGTNSSQCFRKHAVSIKVGTSLLHYIKGKGGMTQKILEEEMGVKIIFPSSKEEESVVVEGNSLESIKKALEKIQVIVDEAVKSPTLMYSHFVSLPLAIHPNLVEKLINFQESILGTAADKLAHLGIDKSIFIKPKTFHLTVLMLKLWNKDRVNEAVNILKEISSKVADALDGRPVFVRLKGLETMRGSLAKAGVLYVPVEEIGGEERLQRACQVIIDAYVEAGLVLEKDAKHKLKLHATVMNTSHRRSKMRSRKFDSFDARGIVKEYGSEDWGEYLIGEAHLSQRFVFDENGYYHCCASIPLPGNTQVEQ